MFSFRHLLAREISMDDHLSTNYDIDFVAWLDQQVALLRSREFALLDITNLIEELADMSAKKKHGLKHRMRVLLAHLLKYQFQPSHISSSWRCTIETQRFRIELLLDESPSLKHRVDAAIAYAYPHAIRLAAAETGLHRARFPVRNPYSKEQILDPDFLPGA
jgi:hypothetical protein